MSANQSAFHPGVERLEPRDVPSTVGPIVDVPTTLPPPPAVEPPPAPLPPIGVPTTDGVIGTPTPTTTRPLVDGPSTPATNIPDLPPPPPAPPPARSPFTLTAPLRSPTPINVVPIPAPMPTPVPPPITPTPPEGSLTQAQRFVTHLYRDVLGRAPDASGLAYWSANLDVGTFTRGQVSAAFISSDEYRANTIVSYYQNILGRTPTTAEVNGYLDQLEGGRSMTDVRQMFFASEEFFARFSRNPAAFVGQLYSQVLGRTGTPAEVNFWVNELNATNGDRMRVVRGFMMSGEYLRSEVSGVYAAVLQRPPEDSGLNYWVSKRSAGLSTEMLTAAVLASDEYYRRAA
ncbi:MAG: DUF4214 domain-containing protein [Fimbriiglobus sp.]|jgi:hypothetical protein|nr:DUF4214 domain-containing protein [Fimbriiglobus sp.]